MADDRALADAELIAEAVAVLTQRVAVLELRAKGTDEDLRRLKQDLHALTKETAP